MFAYLAAKKSSISGNELGHDLIPHPEECYLCTEDFFLECHPDLDFSFECHLDLGLFIRMMRTIQYKNKT